MVFVCLSSTVVSTLGNVYLNMPGKNTHLGNSGNLVVHDLLLTYFKEKDIYDSSAEVFSLNILLGEIYAQ